MSVIALPLSGDRLAREWDAMGLSGDLLVWEAIALPQNPIKQNTKAGTGDEML